MKKVFGFILCILLVFLCAYALADVEINETNFPDLYFRTYVKESFDEDNNNSLSDDEIDAVKTIKAEGQNIVSLKGIEYFPSLTILDCSSNMLPELDISKNTALTELDCSTNLLTALDVSKNTLLTALDCSCNQLTALDISKNTVLRWVSCDNNKLTALDVSKNTSLEDLYCSDNKLTDLNVSKNFALEYLGCSDNQLTALDISKSTMLIWIQCYNNKLTTLDISSNAKLSSLFCYGNQLSVLDVSNCPYLCEYVQDQSRKTNQYHAYDYWIGGQFDLLIDSTVTVTAGNIISEPIEQPQTGIAIDETSFPDDIFRNYVKENLDADGNGSLSDSEIAATNLINVSEKGISSLKGIEYFTALTKLYCAHNRLTELDISCNTSLTALNCWANQLSALDVSRNSALTDLSCADNQLTALDVSSNSTLTSLWCAYNQLTILDISHNTALTWLSCDSNQLTSLNINRNTALTELYCNNNRLSSLDISCHTALTELDCSNNQLTALDVSNNTALTALRCSNNQLTALDVSRNTEIKRLRCNINQIIKLDISKCQNLVQLVIEDSPSTHDTFGFGWWDGDIYDISTVYLFVDEGTKVITGADDILVINETNFPDDIFREYVREEIDWNGNGILNDDEIAGTTNIFLMGKGISSLKGIEYFSSLTDLYCNLNQLTELDVSHNAALKLLYCNDNQLTELDVSHNTALAELLCFNNQLTELDVSNNTALTTLSCECNNLSKLDVSNNTALTILSCDGNNLSKLDVSNNTALILLDCGNNYLSKLDISHNTALSRLCCCGNQLTELDVSNNTGLRFLRCSQNRMKKLDVRNCPTLVQLVHNTSPATHDFYGYGWWVDKEDGSIDTALFIDEGAELITEADDNIPVTSIKLNKTKATLIRTSKKAKPTLQLKATVKPSNATNTAVKWTSSNSKVAKVDQKGKVTALKPGTVTITCTAKDGSGIKATCKVTVKNKLVSKITLNKTKASIKKGKTLKLTVKKITPADAFNQKVKWSSSNKKIATVDKNGKVTAKKKGTCWIICTAADGSGTTVKCKIIVK